MDERISAALKVAKAGYPIGFVVAPLYRHDGWKEGYRKLFKKLGDVIEDDNLTFELIQHRFTKPAKKVIEARYPKTKLEMDEKKRKYKWGRYGIGKYVYQTEEERELKETMEQYIHYYFPNAIIEYFT